MKHTPPNGMVLTDIQAPDGSPLHQIKGTADYIELSGARVTHVRDLVECFHAHLGLSGGEKINSFSYDVPGGQWTITVTPGA